MADEIREEIMLEDGRRAARVIRNEGDPCGCKELGTQVVETWVDPKPKRVLARREIVKTRPCVYERQTEYVNEETGEIETTEIEKTDPEIKLEIREKIVSAASVAPPPDSGIVTREELREDIKDAMVTLARTMNDTPPVMARRISMQDVVGEKVDSSNISPLNIVLLASIAALVAGIAWVLFAM